MQVYASLIPKCSYRGQIGGAPPVPIYVMDKREGVSYTCAAGRSVLRYGLE